MKGDDHIELDSIYTGDCLEVLKTLPDDSFHCCVTSPPYYALRDYGVGDRSDERHHRMNIFRA